MKVFIGRDDDCHNYLIPVENRTDWEDWRDSGEEDLPDYAIQIDGVSEIEFEYNSNSEEIIKDYGELVADLAANLPEFEGCERPLKIGDGWKIREKMRLLEERQYPNLEKTLDYETLFLDKTREGFEGSLEPAYGAACGKRCVVEGQSLVQVLKEMEKQLNKHYNEY